jgi:uncharacterized membrane protein
MAFCTNCGAEVQGRFCAKCGSPAPASPGASAGPAASSAAPPPPPPSASAPFPAADPAPTAQAAGLEENLACALCYVLGLLTGVLFLVLAPYNQNRLIRFHAFQSIFLNIAWIAIFIAISLIGIVLLPIPFLGFMLSVILHLGAGLGVFILWLMLMYKAYNRERWVLPIIGPMAEKQA